MATPRTRDGQTDDQSPRGFGKTVRLLRKTAGLTLIGLAGRVTELGYDLSDEMISYIERGEKLGSIETYWYIAKALRVNIADVVRIVDDNMPQGLVRFLERLEEDGKPPPDDEALAFLRTASVPGRRMTPAAYAHALEMFLAAKKDDDEI